MADAGGAVSAYGRRRAFASGRRPHPVAYCLLFCLAFLMAPVTQGQVPAPSQLTPPTLRPADPPAHPPAAPTPPAHEAPAQRGQESALSSINVQVDSIVVEGGFEDLAKTSQSLLGQYSHRRINGEEIFRVAGALEQAYVSAGYLLVRISMPAQTLRDGAVLRLRLIDGTIEDINADQVPARVRRTVLKRVSPLIGRRAIRLTDLEHYLLLAGNIGGVQLRSTLVAGQAAGTSRLVLAATHKIFAGTMSVDNRLSSAQGPWEAALSCSASSLLGWGEQLYGYGSGAKPNMPARFGRALGVAGGGFVLPLLAGGLSVNPEYTVSKTRTDAQAQIPATNGVFERAALRLTQALTISRAENDEITLSVESLRQTVELPQFGVQLNADRYRAARLQWSQQIRMANGLVESAGLTLSHGLGGRSAKDAATSGIALSRQGAQDNFSTLAGRLDLVQPAGVLQFRFTAAAQTAFHQAVFRSEQFALEGPEGISAFAPGSLPVDQGSTVRGQLEYPWGRSVRTGVGSLTPYLMVAHGAGDINRPSNAEPHAVHANAWGAGLVSAWSASESDRGAQLQLEIAHGSSTLAANKDGFYAHASLVVRF